MGFYSELDIMIREHFEWLKEVYKVEDKKPDSNWSIVIKRMDSYLSALVDTEILSRDDAREYFKEFSTLGCYFWIEEE